MSLTPRQERFAVEVASGKSQAEAYRIAYPKSLKWKDTAVWVQASVLMSNSNVSQRVKDLQAKSAEMAGLDAARIKEEIRRLAHSDIAGIIDPATGKVRLPHELDAATRAAVASFKIDEYGRIEYKFWDKNSSLERAAKILGLFKEDNSQKADALAEFAKAVQGKSIGPVGDGSH